MDGISARALRNHGGRVLQRVGDGATLTGTMDRQPIAELRPVPGRPRPVATALARRRHLPPVDARQRRADLDRVRDASPCVIGCANRAARQAHHQKIFSPWRPFLRDPHDDMVLEVAVEAQCRHIVAFNPRASAGVEPFGLRTLRPGEFLAQRHEDA